MNRPSGTMLDSMGLLVADCPRCGAKHTTFDVVAQTWVSREFSWQDSYEIYCNCRQYHLSTTFLVVASGTAAKNLFNSSFRTHGRVNQAYLKRGLNDLHSGGAQQK